MPSREYFEGKIEKEKFTSQKQEDIDKAKEELLFSQPVLPVDERDNETNDKAEEKTELDSAGTTNVIARKKPSVGGLSDPYNAQYPYNHVTYTESGHMIEYDDTPGSERINIQHRSGAYIEIHPEGHIVISASKYHQQSKELHIGVAGNAKLDIGGNMTASVGGDAGIGVRGDVGLETDGNLTAVVEGRTTLRSAGVTSLAALSDVYVQADSSVHILSSGNMNMSAQGSFNVRAKEINLDSSADTNIHAGGKMDLNSASNFTAYGSRIDLNKDGATAATIKAPFNATFTDEDLVAFSTDLGEQEFDFDFDLPQHTAVGPNGEMSRSKQAMQSYYNIQNENRGGGSYYSGPGNVYVPKVKDIKIIQKRGDEKAGQVEYRNSEATRNKELVKELEEIIMYAAKEADVDVIIFSGGQDKKGEGTRRTGSVRHDNGYGVDVWIYDREFKYQYRTDRSENHKDTAKVKSFIAKCVEKGGDKVSAGAGANYMGGTGIHVDIAIGNNIPKGSARHWAANGSSRYSPSWLRTVMA